VMGDFFGSFREFIAAGAFTKTLKDGADVRALVNHNPDYVLGRTKSGTLSLREDDHGLWMDIQPPGTRWAEDLMTTMKRGDVDGSSFGFQVIRDRWGNGEADDGEKVDERTILEAKLFDVSVVTFPAYPQTEAQVRSLFAGVGLDVDALARAIMRCQRQLPVTDADRAVLRSAIAQLRAFLPVEQEDKTAPARTGHPVEPAISAPSQTGHPLSYYREWLSKAQAIK